MNSASLRLVKSAISSYLHEDWKKKETFGRGLSQKGLSRLPRAVLLLCDVQKVFLGVSVVFSLWGAVV